MKSAVLFLVSITLSVVYSLSLEDLLTKELTKISESEKEDCRLNFTQLVAKHKYPAEAHQVYTEDGYILTVHRIPNGKHCKSGKPKIPVLLGHGLFSSSVEYILYGPEEGLGYLLADKCYDVWLSNSRGNRYSRLHQNLTVADKKFWDFSWHELGASDMPAVIDYILKVTGQPDLHYIGLSQGTTQFFVFGSLYPEYHKKIRSAHCMAPVAYMEHIKHPLITSIYLLAEPVFNIVEKFGIYETMPLCKLLNLIGHTICSSEHPDMKTLCGNIVFLLTGSTTKSMNTTLLPVVLCHTPAGSSLRQILHYKQLIRKDYFRQFSYGRVGNINKYGTQDPPSYDLHNINIPTALYFGDNDWFADVIDVDRIGEELPNLIGKFRTPMKDFGHVDFHYGTNVRSLVYDRILSILKRY